MLHNGAVALLAKKESKKWTVANVGNHTREKETCRERQRRGRGGTVREIERHRQARGKDSGRQKTETETCTEKLEFP